MDRVATEERAALALQEIKKNLDLSRELSDRLTIMAAQAQATRALLEAAIAASDRLPQTARKRPASPESNFDAPSSPRRLLILQACNIRRPSLPGPPWPPMQPNWGQQHPTPQTATSLPTTAVASPLSLSFSAAQGQLLVREGQMVVPGFGAHIGAACGGPKAVACYSDDAPATPNWPHNRR